MRRARHCWHCPRELSIFPRSPLPSTLWTPLSPSYFLQVAVSSGFSDAPAPGEGSHGQALTRRRLCQGPRHF